MIHVLAAADLQVLIDLLRGDGYRVLGPVLGNGAIVYDELVSIDQLPAGQHARQEPGVYRLEARTDGAWFAFAVGPDSWKRVFHPPSIRLWRTESNGRRMKFVADDEPPVPVALLGVRACDLAAIARQDKVLLGGPYVDAGYGRRRDRAFLIAVNCAVPGGTCFCRSMRTGPRAAKGFDLALTELVEEQGGGAHRFLVEVGSQKGADMLARLPTRAADEIDCHAGDAISAAAAEQMGRQVDMEGVKHALARSHEHPQWDAIAKRCLTCANCTMVCPTCFCTTVEDTTDLAGEHAERWRHWDTCFGLEFTYVHGGSVRKSGMSRYRQWLTHKFSSWADQFGEPGCVGCGRCITWCPVGIDVTREVATICATTDGRGLTADR